MRPAKGNSPGEAAELPKRSYKCGNLAAAAAIQLTRGWDAPLQELSTKCESVCLCVTAPAGKPSKPRADMQGPVAYKTPSSGLAGTGSQMETLRGALHAGESNRAQECEGLALAMSERQAADVASYRH